jgi:DNA-binding NarL/FixJ family response regulator
MYAVLADDHDLVRESIAATLSHVFSFTVLQAKDAGQAVALTRKHNPALVILDMMMSGMDTFEAATLIRQDAPRTKVIILTGRAEVDLVIRARSLKIHGYALKGDSLDEIRYAINTVMKGGAYVPPSLSEQLLDPERSKRASALDVLTQKEKATLSLLAQGNSMKEVASYMNISVKTAETHRNNLGRKLGHPNKAQIFAFAILHKLVDMQSLAICT